MIIKIADDIETYKKTAEILDNKGIVAMPVDTIYSFAVDGTSEEAIKRLKSLKFKEENLFTYFIPKNLLKNYTVLRKKKIIDYFIPGPIIVILKKNPECKLGDSEEKIGVQIPLLNFIMNFLDYYKKPLATIEAHIPGESELQKPIEILKKFPEIELIIDAGILNGKPPTILDLTTPIPVVRRKGAVPILTIEKVYGRRIRLDPSLKFNLLLVCSGNSCRSPMAQGIIKTMLNEKYVEVKSAGTAAMDGLPASENARAVVKEFGGDISDHKTRYITKELVDEADLILVMEFKHYEAVLELSPDAALKTFLLKEYKRRTKYNEVSDPVGKDITGYRDTALEIYPSLKFVAEDIKKRLMV